MLGDEWWRLKKTKQVRAEKVETHWRRPRKSFRLLPPQL